jgi:hypothetical protein
MMRKPFLMVAVSGLLGLAACGDQLSVPNVDQPDVDRVLSSPDGVEATVAGMAGQVFNASHANESINTQTKLLADESYATVANYGMGARLGTRNIVVNSVGNENQTGNVANFNSFQRLARGAANVIAAMQRHNDNGFSLGSVALDNRTKAFGWFILGQTLANVSFGYDSAAVVDPSIPTSDIPELSGYAEVNAAALAAYDQAIAIATSPEGMADIDAGWLSQTTDMSPANFVRLIRSLKARARAGVARTEADRAAVDWAAVIADATNGITADFVVQTGGTTGWTVAFDVGTVNAGSGWHLMPMRLIGMADISGAYQTWAAAPEASKAAFVVQTPDLRWPQGATRAAQQADTPSNTLTGRRYIRNRSGLDVPVVGSGDSFYDWRRYGGLSASPTGGPYVEMAKAEIDMLRAEGHIRLNQHAQAEPLIDITRVPNGLSSVVGVGTGTIAEPNCVPRLPNGACATLLEAMKYEKRMETAYTGYMIWYTDLRGWGDLRANTVIEWPVPYQELQARRRTLYDGTNVATASNYAINHN